MVELSHALGIAVIVIVVVALGGIYLITSSGSHAQTPTPTTVATQSTTAMPTTVATQSTTQSTTTTINLGGVTCKNKTCYLNLTASNDSNLYLNSYVSATTWSDWMHYAPLVNTVNQIVAGKNTTYDKALAIAIWVRASRPYGISPNTILSVANSEGSVIDIFKESAGVCLDAATLTVAMLRLAGIPARIISPSAVQHAYAEAYINGKWIGIDSTFSNVTNNGSNMIHNLTTPASTFIYWGNGSNVNITNPLAGNWTLTNVSLGAYPTILLNNSGQVTYPNEKAGVFSNRAQYNLSYQRYSTAVNYGPIQCVYATSNYSCDWYNCYHALPNQTGYFYVVRSPGLVRFATDSRTMKVEADNPLFNGYITTSLPPGNYQLRCGVGGETLNYTAYAYFTIKPEQNFNVTENMFKKSDNASNSDFNITMQLLFNQSS